MLSNARIKRLKSYQQKKFRRQEGLFIAETPKVAQVLLSGSLAIREIYALPAWLENPGNQKLLSEYRRHQGHEADTIRISPDELERISALASPQEVFMVVEYPPAEDPPGTGLDKGCSLLLDDIRDPGNLGTILRIADWFGIEHVICTMECADAFQPKCVQASMGSVGVCDIRYLDRDWLLHAIEAKKDGLQAFGMFMDGESIYRIPLPEKNCWYVIGNEARGIAPDFSSRIGKRIGIPPAAKHRPSGAESLNAAIAAALLCAQIRKQ